jgi:hypothetical protein
VRKAVNEGMPGAHFGLWTVVSEAAPKASTGDRMWNCRCACGTEREVEGGSLRRGQSRSCGCVRKAVNEGMLGAQYGLWTVIAEAAPKASTGDRMWNCRCACGTEREIKGSQLRRGATRSCGCWFKGEEYADKTRARFTTHGMSNTPTYVSYTSMLSRCCNLNFPGFAEYGGRGIKVCDRWLTSFENFFEDMGPRPAGCSLERKDNNGPYSKENCIWADRLTQNNNKRSNRWLTSHGLKMTVAQWARHRGLPSGLVGTRLTQLGWPAWKALGFAGPD